MTSHQPKWADLFGICPDFQIAEEPDEERLRLARSALVGTGYFTADEVGPDVAPRITELHAALTARLAELEAQLAGARLALGVVKDALNAERAGRL
jgi:hypothetical protein